MKTLQTTYLGLTRYQTVWDLQKKLFDLRVAGEIDDILLLNEHHPVYTLGKSSDDNHLLAEQVELERQGIDLHHIDRGGDVTFHGPGQLVGYPIMSIAGERADVHRYLRDIEEVIIRTLAEYGIAATRDSDFTGVWVGNNKIAALGIKVSHWVTMHGFALNINTDLAYFDRIIPCGIFHKGVTSMERLLGRRVPLEEIAERIIFHIGQIFEAVPVAVPPDEIWNLPHQESAVASIQS